MEPYIAISLFALFISLLSYLFVRRSWYETYRPIVSASVETYASGNVTTLFNIVVYNTGNRPAVTIKLHTNKEKLEKVFGENASEILKNGIKDCFSEKATIPLLHEGKSIHNAFGVVSHTETTIKLGSEIPIFIEYCDLNRRKYKTKQTLIFKDSIFFAGTGFKKREES